MDRFIMELEFVQMLSNPSYLQFLQQQQLFEDKAFKNYLKYLKYWQDPKYAQYVTYPYSLTILDLLCEEKYENIATLHHKEFKHWEMYRKENEPESIEMAKKEMNKEELRI